MVFARIAARMLGGGHSEDLGGPPSQEVTNGKIALLVILAPLTLLASAAPWCAQRLFKKNSLNVLNLLSALAAGFIFGAFALHAIPESSEMFKEYLEPRYAPTCVLEVHVEDTHRARLLEETAAAGAEVPELVCGKKSFVPDYPWALLTASLTWLLLVFLDRAIVSHGLEGTDHHSHDHVSQAFVAMQVEKEGGAAAEKEGEGGVPPPAKEAPEAVTLRSTSPPTATPTSKESTYDTVAASVNHSHCSHDHAAITVGEGGVTKSAGEALSEKNARKDAVLRACVYFVALSLHSVFDGLGVGVVSNMQDFASITVAVVAHKAFDGIALGVPVYLAKLSPLMTWGSLVFCALMTPMGIAIGWGVREAVQASGNKLLAEAIIISLTAGSFLYISASELLPASLHDGRLVPWKILCFSLGFGAMAILAGYV